MKITRDKALAMTAYCRQHKLKYVGQGSYPNTVRAAHKSDTKAPNGVLLHSPREWIDESKQAIVSNNRVYVLWQGEPIPAIEEACAYVYMIDPRKEIYVVRCRTASQATEQVEQEDLCDPSSDS